MQDNRPSWFNPQISAGTVVQLIAFVTPLDRGDETTATEPVIGGFAKMEGG